MAEAPKNGVWKAIVMFAHLNPNTCIEGVTFYILKLLATWHTLVQVQQRASQRRLYKGKCEPETPAIGKFAHTDPRSFTLFAV